MSGQRYGARLTALAPSRERPRVTCRSSVVLARALVGRSAVMGSLRNHSFSGALNVFSHRKDGPQADSAAHALRRASGTVRLAR